MSFGDALVEAGVPLLLFLDLGLLRAFEQELESERTGEKCVSLVVPSLASLMYLLSAMALEVTPEEE